MVEEIPEAVYSLPLERICFVEPKKSETTVAKQGVREIGKGEEKGRNRKEVNR